MSMLIRKTGCAPSGKKQSQITKRHLLPITKFINRQSLATSQHKKFLINEKSFYRFQNQ